MSYHYQFAIMAAIRKFFLSEGFLDVLTPPMVSNPGMETHIHPFKVQSVAQKKDTPFYLHTSPEFFMKKLLSEGFEKIFTISYCMRDEPSSEIHRPQFLMLEWYRSNEHYSKIIEDVERLIFFCLEGLKSQNIPTRFSKSEITFEHLTMQQLFKRYTNVDILNYLDIDSLCELIKTKFPEVPLPSKTDKLLWDDYFFLLFLNVVNPNLKKHPFLIVTEFPAPLAALSTLSPQDPRVCERFELYIDGVEIANCFNELTNLKEQKKRFALNAADKKSLYGYELPPAKVLYTALERGLPKSSGIALGVERLLAALVDIKNPFFDE